MKVIAAYLLAVLGGNTAPSADDLRDILGAGTLFSIATFSYFQSPFRFISIGAEANDDNISNFLSEVKGKDIAEVIAAGREQLASVPSGGGAAVAVAPAPGGGGGSAPAAAESKKEEKVEEKEESDDDMGFSLFD
ncbi:60S acidic ribosomal protein P2-2-like isoform X1 [Abrus precatorius]|uniref:60S acidic ribosomal protein P2-2-like isoform X1 n=1 Tax=Abrus precatorius TaxID=3816 RepID=A0A8B8L7E7_ABRPR|nr:60S acidic ribosomal protein P2-2-like isoform X1 [Abrus precatorius]